MTQKKYLITALVLIAILCSANFIVSYAKDKENKKPQVIEETFIDVKNGKTGVITKNNKKIIPYKYDKIEKIDDNYFKTYIKEEKEITSDETQTKSKILVEKQGIISINGKVINSLFSLVKIPPL